MFVTHRLETGYWSHVQESNVQHSVILTGHLTLEDEIRTPGVHKLWAPGHRRDRILKGGAKYLRTRSMELASFHTSLA